MTRAEILAQYEIKDGIIVSPGKFEGEPLYAPYFYSIWLDGGADSASLAILPEDRKAFPEIPARRRKFWLSEDAQGFFYIR